MANPNLWSDDKKRNKLIEEYDAVGNANPQNITEAVEKYQNRKPFSYNYENDPMYANLREAAIRNGQMAMKDTMGKATALTGGYMNSYAQRVGQSAYNQYMDALNDKIPQLEQTAYERYRQGIEDDIKNIDIQQMLYNVEQKGYDAQRDAIANQIGFREDAMKQDYPLLNLPYTNEQAYNQQSRLDRMETNNNIYEHEREKAIDRQYENSSGTQNINNTYEYYNNLMEKGLIDEEERDARIKASLGLTATANTNLIEKGSTDDARFSSAIDDYVENGNYRGAGDEISSYMSAGRISEDDGLNRYLNVLRDSVNNKKLTKKDAIDEYVKWVKTSLGYELTKAQEKSMREELESQIGSDYVEKRNVNEDFLKDAWTIARQIGTYTGDFNSFMHDFDAGRVLVKKDKSVRVAR